MPRGAGIVHARHPGRILRDGPDCAQPWAVPELQSERLGPGCPSQAAGTGAERFPIHRPPGQVGASAVYLLPGTRAACPWAKLLEAMQRASLLIENHVKGGCCHVRQTHSLGCTVISGMPKLVRLAKQLDWRWLASACHLQPAVNWLLAIPCRGCTCLSSSATTS